MSSEPSTEYVPRKKSKVNFYLYITVGAMLLSTPFMFIFYGHVRLKAEINKLKRNGYAADAEGMHKLYAPLPPGKDAATLYYKAQNRMVKPSGKPYSQEYDLALSTLLLDPSNKIINGAREYLKANQEAIEVFERAAKIKQARFKRKWKDGSMMLLPELSDLRYFARLNLLRIKEAVRNNDPQKVVKLLNQMESVRNWASEDPTVISSLVGIAIEAIKLSALEYAVNNLNLTDKQLQEQIKQLSHVEKSFKKNAPRMMQGEIALTLVAFKKPETIMGNNPVTKFVSISQIYTFDATKYLELNVPLIENIGGEYYKVKSVINNHNSKLKKLPRYYLITKIMTPALSSLNKKFTWIYADIRNAQAALAVKLYRRKYGKLPDSLSQVVPEFLPAVPLDPFDGKPLRYFKGEFEVDYIKQVYDPKSKRYDDEKIKRKKRGFYVYSIGHNLKDDGGSPHRKRHRRNPVDPTFTIFDKSKK